MASSSSSSRQMKHHVFLSFRGEDTRLNFTAHLLKALQVKGLDVFFDERNLLKGEPISLALANAISFSNLSIIILSPDYASSKSCLAELSDIMDRKHNQGQIVLPVFYHVHPCDVQNLGGTFTKSFEDHDSKGLDQVQRWKDAFTGVGKLEGQHIEGGKFDRPETEHIKDIVEYVIRKLMKHQVFLSFRDEDTGRNFTSHLLKALKDRGINVFSDKWEKFPRAISVSNLSIIVLSVNYASSESCLAELSEIMDRKGNQGQIVLPIFYHVDPSDIRNLRGSFKACFDNHEPKGIDKVHHWKQAFARVGKLKGWHIEGGKFDRPDTQYIKDVIEYAIRKLNSKSRSVSEDWVGIDDQKKVILGLIEQRDIRVIGLWGPGGIGKTTLAQAVYDEICPKFQSYFFLLNVREEIKNKGMKLVRNELLSKLLEDRIDIDTPSIGSIFIQERLHNKKVIVVLDDVDDYDHIACMGIKHFGEGSKIIVSSRDRQVLRNGGADKIYEVKKLNENDSLQLFATFAFKLLNPPVDFQDLSKQILWYAQGSPLALKVLGSKLYTKSRLYWESEVDKLKDYAEPKLSQILKSSFDGLDMVEKKIFLDIACFLKGKSKEEVQEILSYLYNGAISGINNLVDKCLIHFNDGYISMHDMLEEMGKDIVRQESKNVGKRSRLWSLKDVNQVSGYNKVNNSIEGIKVGMVEIENLQLCPTVFENMVNLRYIDFCVRWRLLENENLLGDKVDSVSLPDELRYLSWDFYPFKSFTPSFKPKNLFALKLCHGNIEKLWNEDHQDLLYLRKMDLTDCKNLRKIPNLLGAINLKSLDCSGCESLVKLPCLNHLTSLKTLRLSHCMNLVELPSLNHLASLETLQLSHCKNLVELPSLNHLTSLETLQVSVCKNLRRIPNLSEVINLKNLECDSCISLVELPCLSHLTSLERLKLCACKNLRKIPNLLGVINLKTLDCRWSSSLVELPCLDHLKSLECLKLCACKNLRMIPNLVGATNLKTLDCRWCESLDELPCLGHLKSLEFLELRACKNLRKIPSLSGAVNLKTLDCRWCKSLVELPCFSHLTSLEKLKLCACKGLRRIPSLSGAISLKTLDCRWCENLVEFPCLSHLTSLERLNLCACKNLRMIPNLLGDINLKTLDCRWCDNLVELPSLNDLISLEWLLLCSCKSLTKIPNLLGAINLKILDCRWCKSLVELPCLSDLTSLECLKFCACKNLRMIPNLLGAINLRTFDCRWCGNLVELPSLNDLTSLEWLLLCACKSLRNIPSLSGAINLKTLDCRWCESLVELPCLSGLTSLKSLQLSGCSSLTERPNNFAELDLPSIETEEVLDSIRHLFIS
ncbi:hypothetical protein V6N13_038466 [Hibiscus sabdariffa]